MTRTEISTRALNLAQEIDVDVEEGSKFHMLCKIGIKAAVNASENNAFTWILKNFGREAAQRYTEEVE